MPVLIDKSGIFGTAEARREQARLGGVRADCIDIGLVNNVPDAALEATERQFVELLAAAAGGLVVRLRFFSLPDVPRTERGRHHLRTYADIGDLWNARLDGIIVTGTEPRTAELRNEPYWRALTKVIDWAEDNTISAIWSCLAAHAAVLHLDGIERHPLEAKCTGIFECQTQTRHQLTAGGPATLRTPHSRYNGLRASELAASGYDVLTTSRKAGVDMFVRQRKNLFVFFQGHPEYDARSLLGEYRRDIGRYLRREIVDYPGMPSGYFDAATADALNAFRKRATADRRRELLASFPSTFAEESLENTWRASATNVYRNWLAYLSAQKAERIASAKPVHALRLISGGRDQAVRKLARPS